MGDVMLILLRFFFEDVPDALYCCSILQLLGFSGLSHVYRHPRANGGQSDVN